MARPRDFDADEVVAKALTIFWTRGYLAVAVDDVLTATGLGRQSFYNAFGDKRSLLLRCLERYRASQLAMLAGHFDNKPTVLAGFVALFEATIAEPDQNKRKGCLVLAAAAELSASDLEIADIAANHQLAIEDLFASHLTKAATAMQHDAEPLLTIDAARKVARFLTVTYLGLRVVGKSDPRSTAQADSVRLVGELLATLLPSG